MNEIFAVIQTVIGFGRPSQVPRVRFYCSCERKRTIMGIIILSSNTEYAVSSLINVIVATLPSRVKGMKKKPWKYWYVNNIIAYINIKIAGIVQTCSVAYWEIQLSIEMQTCSRFAFSCLQLVTIFSFISLYCTQTFELPIKLFHEIFDLVNLM